MTKVVLSILVGNHILPLELGCKGRRTRSVERKEGRRERW